MVLKIMCQHMKEIYQIFLELTSKNPDGTFKLSQSHLVEKIINHVGLELSASLKAREKPDENLLLHKEEYRLGRKYVWNYRSAVDMIIYLQR